MKHFVILQDSLKTSPQPTIKAKKQNTKQAISFQSEAEVEVGVYNRAEAEVKWLKSNQQNTQTAVFTHHTWPTHVKGLFLSLQCIHYRNYAKTSDLRHVINFKDKIDIGHNIFNEIQKTEHVRRQYYSFFFIFYYWSTELYYYVLFHTQWFTLCLVLRLPR